MKHWVTTPADEAATERLAGELGCPSPFARILVARGLGQPSEARRFLHPALRDLGDPFELPGMRAAAGAVWSALADGRPTVVYGDYDVDGLTATALLVGVLRKLGAQVEAFLPHRTDDGYGLVPETLDKCVERHHPGFLVTVDCGTNAAAAVERARAHGVDVVITDHHQPSGPPAPAVAVMNPRLGDPASPEFDLSGVGVAFKLAHAVVKIGLERGSAAARGLASRLKDHLDLVVLGTVADCVPLRGENRIYVRHGLPLLDRPAGVGLRALREVAAVRGATDTYHVGFLLGPRLNASGRLGTAEKALELLMTDDPGRGRRLAEELDAANRERQAIERRIFEEARALIDARHAPELEPGIVIAHEGWHPGVIGIVASRLCGFYSRPSIVIALDGDCGRGSCRSVEAVDLVACLRDCAAVLPRYGGHSMAAGLDVARDRIDELRRLFFEAIGRRVTLAALHPVLHVDAWIGLKEADDRLLKAMADLRPCGQGNPEPVWAVAGVRLLYPRKVGDRHLKMTVEQGGVRRDAIAFGFGDRPIPEGAADVAFELKENTWNGATSLQLHVRDIRSSPSNSLSPSNSNSSSNSQASNSNSNSNSKLQLPF